MAGSTRHINIRLTGSNHRAKKIRLPLGEQGNGRTGFDGS
jgi:hypothetical protein